MLSLRSVALLFVVLTANSSAFVSQTPSARTSATLTTANMVENEGESSNSASSRRDLFRTIGFSLVAAAAVSTSPRSASATYSAFTRREQDWQERLDKGEVQVSSARDLRRQLREIAPMNDEGSKIFCPNGPSSAVSPLMENKCGDREAIPSVYGRTQDVVGNSIPGFSGGRYTSNIQSGVSSNVASEIGGFPSYDPKMGRR